MSHASLTICSELELTLGKLDAAIADAERSVGFTDRGKDWEMGSSKY